MTGDQGNKRLKTASGASGVDTGEGEDTSDDVRIDALKSETHALRSENARVRQENARLRKQLQGNHEVLPVSTLTVVDLSRIDTSLITQISSFVGSSLELLNLALTCKSFGWQQPLSGLDWSLAEEWRDRQCVQDKIISKACALHCRSMSGARRRGCRFFTSLSTQY